MNEPFFQNLTPQNTNNASHTLSDTEKEARRSISRLGLALTVFSLLPQIVAVLLSILVPIVFPAWVKSDWYVWAVQVFCLYIIGLSAFFLILGKKPLPPLSRKGERFSGGWHFGFFCILVFCALVGSLISALLTGGLSFLRGGPIENTTTTLILSSKLIYVFVIAVVIGPIVEELVYRHAVMRVLLPYGERAAILLSGLIFGLTHGNFYQFFYGAGIGILLSYLYARTGKLRHTIAAHMLFNFFGAFLPAVILYYLPIDKLVTGNLTPDVIYASILPILGLLLYELAYVGLAITGLVIFIVRLRRTRFFPADCPIDKRARSRVYFGNLGMILFFAVSLIFFVISVL